MRYFKLENSANQMFDITTEEFLFHEIAGLGLEEENHFLRIGPLWRLESSAARQKPITGKMCFTDRGDTTPYEKFEYFGNFIASDPLYLCYWPHGLSGKVYRKRVRVSILEKSELNKYGVLDERIEFTPLTAWFEKVYAENHIDDDLDTATWIWDQGALWRDSFDGPLPPGGDRVRYRFGGESRSSVSLSCGENANGLTKLTIHGPATNPSWRQHVDGALVSIGGISPDKQLQLNEHEMLIVDNTMGDYTMTVLNSTTRVRRNVYPLRDFDKECFIKLKSGVNTISVVSEDGTPLKIEMEGHLYYATV